VQARIAAFEEKTKDMTGKDPLEKFPILAAKYKNRWVANRFLVSVLEEFTLRFCDTFADSIIRSKAAKKRMDDPKYKKVFEDYVNQEIASYKKEYIAKLL
jgi:C4-type Zn-finger protein